MSEEKENSNFIKGLSYELLRFPNGEFLSVFFFMTAFLFNCGYLDEYISNMLGTIILFSLSSGFFFFIFLYNKKFPPALLFWFCSLSFLYRLVFPHIAFNMDSVRYSFSAILQVEGAILGLLITATFFILQILYRSYSLKIRELIFSRNSTFGLINFFYVGGMLCTFLFLNYDSSLLQNFWPHVGINSNSAEYMIYNWASFLFIYNLSLIPLYTYEIYCRFDVAGELLRNKDRIKIYYHSKESFEKELRNYYYILQSSIEKKEYEAIHAVLTIMEEIFHDLAKKKRENTLVLEDYPKKLLIRLDNYAMVAPEDIEVAREFSNFYSLVHKKLDAKELKENGYIILRTLRKMALKSIGRESESINIILNNLFIFKLISKKNIIENYIGDDYTIYMSREFRSILEFIKKMIDVSLLDKELLQEAKIRLFQAFYYLKRYDFYHLGTIFSNGIREDPLCIEAAYRVKEYQYPSNEIKNFFVKEDLEGFFKKI